MESRHILISLCLLFPWLWHSPKLLHRARAYSFSLFVLLQNRGQQITAQWLKLSPVLLKHSHAHSFTNCLWLFSAQDLHTYRDCTVKLMWSAKLDVFSLCHFYRTWLASAIEYLMCVHTQLCRCVHLCGKLYMNSSDNEHLAVWLCIVANNMVVHILVCSFLCTKLHIFSWVSAQNCNHWITTYIYKFGFYWWCQLVFQSSFTSSLFYKLCLKFHKYLTLNNYLWAGSFIMSLNRHILCNGV